MAAAMKTQKTGLLELRVTVDRWVRVLATLTEDALTLNPGDSADEPAKPGHQSPAGAVNGDPPNLSSSPVPETITNVKRTVRVTKQDVGGLGISIKGKPGVRTGGGPKPEGLPTSAQSVASFPV